MNTDDAATNARMLDAIRSGLNQNHPAGQILASLLPILSDVRAAAWDEGAESAGDADYMDADIIPNPYRNA